ncbi:MAG: HTH-type transcriptional activator IlvY [Candidatus Latescibacteria bacterium]|nr:HTH-type transcriptional activator IlvY [Candidatus Latescibacterota bacterium]
MDFRQLEFFLQLAGLLHFGRASRVCFVSPPTLTRAIQRLEEEVGCPLFIRDRQRVELTPAGQVFKEYARQTLEDWQQVQQGLSRAGETLRGELRLYGSITACYSILPRILPAYRRAYPQVRLKLVTGDASQALGKIQDDEVDIAVAALPEQPPQGMRQRIVTYTPLSFIRAREAADQIVDWGRVPMIFPEAGLIRHYLDRWFRDQDLAPHIYGEVSGHEAIISLVALGFGIGVVPELVLEKSALAQEVEVVSVEPRLPPYRVGLAAKRRRLEAPLARAFWDLCETTTQQEN